VTRTLHVTSGNLFGGVETLLISLARVDALREPRRLEFALCFEGRLAAELRAHGAVVHMLGPVRASRPLSVWRARRRLRGLLAAREVDAVVCHAPWAQALLARPALDAGVPEVYFAHAPAAGRHWLERMARRARPAAAVANSAFTASTLDVLYPGVSRECVYPPVWPPPADAGARRDAMRADLGASERTVVVLQVSRMEEWKGQRRLLAALASLGADADWQYWLSGGAQTAAEQHYERELRALAERLAIGSRVRFLGQRSDVPALLAAADVFCQPNAAPEPFGIALVEALYAALPAVTTAFGGAAEIVTPECGVLVAPGDDAALAAALRDMVMDAGARTRLGSAGPARAMAISDPVTQASRLEAAVAIAAERAAATGIRPTSARRGAPAVAGAGERLL